MLDKIIHFALHNRLVVLVAALLLMMAGLYTAYEMEVDVFPDLNAPTVVVMTEATGLAPEEVEQMVTFPLETAVNGATGVRRVRSSSTMGFSVVWVEFDWDTDVYLARQIVTEKVALVRDQLPPTVGTPTLGPQSSILGELLFVGLTADTTSQQELRTIADRTLRPRLLALGGVAQVAVIGGEIREYQVLLQPERMRLLDVSLGEVLESVEQMNLNASGGVLYEYGNEYLLRGILGTREIAELGSAVVKVVEGRPITLEQIATVQIGNHAPRLGLASIEGKPGVLLTITKQPHSGTMELTQRIDATIQELQKQLPADVSMRTDLYRQERFIESAISNVTRSLVEGGVFVVLVLFLFLMNSRTTLISLVTIPLSLLASLLALRYMGFTINTMSLGGMAIAIGSLVDDAIVDVENVYKRLRENRQLPSSERLSPLTVVYNASREVRMPILYSTLIVVVSFAPLFFLSGMEGRLLVPLGIAFIVALSASTVVALTLTPVLCYYLLGKRKGEAQEPREPFLSRWFKGEYDRLLGWALTHRHWVLGSTAVAAVGALVAFTQLGRSFLPPFNEGSFTINLSSMPGISLEESDRLGAEAERLLMEIPEIASVARKTGRAELDEHALGTNASEIEAPFSLDHGRSKEELVAEVRERLATLPGLNVEVGAPITHRIDAMLSGTRASLAIKVFGPDLNRLFSLGNQIKEALVEVEGLADLNVEQQVERPQLTITPRRAMMARHGVTLPEFSRTVSVLLSGEAVSQIYEGNLPYELVVRADESARNSIEAIRALPVRGSAGSVPLSVVADVTSSSGPHTINREEVSRKIVVSANIAGRDQRSVVREIEERISEQVEIPEGYHFVIGGQHESEERASRILLLTSMGALLVIFLLLYRMFGNGRLAGIVMVNLPLALIGGVLAIFFTGDGIMSIPSIIGFISLFGIATRNGMLLISRYNDLRAEGMSVEESVRRGSVDRLVPILMTAFTTALALIPLALGGELPGNEIQSPMAEVILGGLLTSTWLNGFVVPIMYTLSHRD